MGCTTLHRQYSKFIPHTLNYNIRRPISSSTIHSISAQHNNKNVDLYTKCSCWRSSTEKKKKIEGKCT